MESNGRVEFNENIMSRVMMETEFHKLLKRVAIRELQEDGFVLYIEPSEPPMKRVNWEAYRPDIVGINAIMNHINLVLVECETTPTKKRIMNKTNQITQTVSLQKRLHEWHLFRLLLLIPTFTFNRINFFAIRRVWEIWIVNRKGVIAHKLPLMKLARSRAIPYISLTNPSLILNTVII